MRYHFKVIGITIIKKPNRITNVDKDVEKLETLSTVGKYVKWHSPCGKLCDGFSKKLKIEISHALIIPLLGMYAKKLKTGFGEIFTHSCS